MYIISVYDISTITKAGRKRIVKIMKKFRQYLHHTQRSVFEGNITEAKFNALKIEINNLINAEEDNVIFFRIDNINNITKDIVGIKFDPTYNII